MTTLSARAVFVMNSSSRDCFKLTYSGDGSGSSKYGSFIAISDVILFVGSIINNFCSCKNQRKTDQKRNGDFPWVFSSTNENCKCDCVAGNDTTYQVKCFAVSTDLVFVHVLHEVAISIANRRNAKGNLMPMRKKKRGKNRKEMRSSWGCIFCFGTA